MIKIFTCEDCRFNREEMCCFCRIPRNLKDPPCPNFRTKDGKLPRFFRMVQDIDVMAENVVFYDDNYVGLSGWYFRGTRYFSKDKAIEAAKAWMMEFEDGNE